MTVNELIELLQELDGDAEVRTYDDMYDEYDEIDEVKEVDISDERMFPLLLAKRMYVIW